METQHIMNSENYLEKEKWNWRNQVLDFSLYYKTAVITPVWYSHKKQTYRSMEQDRKPSDKPAHL